jgi:hypothetical protein
VGERRQEKKTESDFLLSSFWNHKASSSICTGNDGGPYV